MRHSMHLDSLYLKDQANKKKNFMDNYEEYEYTPLNQPVWNHEDLNEYIQIVASIKFDLKDVQ